MECSVIGGRRCWGFKQPAFHDDSGGLGIDCYSIAPPLEAGGARFGKPFGSVLRTVPFIDKGDGQAVTFLQLSGKTAGGATGWLFTAIEGQRQADDQGVRQPFLVQGIERCQSGSPSRTAIVVSARGAGGKAIADRHASEFAADIETEHTAHAWPA
jgi:hypothetical protein